MQQDIIAAYKQVCGHAFSQRDAYEKTVTHPAPRYYVSAKQASQVIAPMMRGDFDRVNLMWPLRKQMYYNLFDEVVKLSEKREFIGKSLSYIVRFAVLQPAPRFYIKWEQAKRIRIWLKKGYYDENGKVKDDKVPYYKKCRDRWQAKKEVEQ